MDRIGIVGTSWRRGGVDSLGSYAISAEGIESRLPELAERAGVDGLVYLSTCNRVEVVLDLSRLFPRGEEGHPNRILAGVRRRIFEALTGRTPEPGDAERALTAWVGEGAIEHLYLVASGLDSAKLGETDIHGQLRTAIDRSRSAGLLTDRLDLVVEDALKVAKRVRAATGLGRGHVSLAEIASDRAIERLGCGTGGRAVLLGVSTMTERCAKSLGETSTEIVVVNRTLARAEALAAEFGGSARSIDQFRKDPGVVDVLISATGSPDPVLGEESLRKFGAHGDRPSLLIDMAVPPDIDPEAARAAGVDRIGMEEILAEAANNKEERVAVAAEARDVIDAALESFAKKLTERDLAPRLAAIQKVYRNAALEGAEKLFRRDLEGLDEGQRESVRRFAESLAKRLAHLPSNGIRGLAHDHGMAPVEAFLGRGGGELRRELESASESSGPKESVHSPLDPTAPKIS